MNQHRNAYPKLHNAMWPGLVGKGSPGAEDFISLEKMLDKVFASESGQIQAKALLAQKHGLFAIDDTQLQTALESLSPTSRLAESLRDMALKHRSAWRRELVKVRLSFPPNADFPDENCVVCDGSEWLGHRLVIFDGSETLSIRLVAGSWRPCQPQETGPGHAPENVQIKFKAARKLYGNKPLNKFEDGWVGFAD